MNHMFLLFTGALLLSVSGCTALDHGCTASEQTERFVPKAMRGGDGWKNWINEDTLGVAPEDRRAPKPL